MIAIGKARKTDLRPGALAPPVGAPPAVSKNHLSRGFSAQPSTVDSGVQQEKNSFLNERTLNVYENKGSVWKACWRDANVYETKAVSSNIRECR
jgi:hypothetical protein